MKNWKLRLAIILVITSLGLYVVHYLLFHDLHHILLFGMHEIAFLPLEVLVVTIILERIISHYEEKERKSKLKILIGAAFSEFGLSMLSFLAPKLDAKTRAQFANDKIEALAKGKLNIPRYLRSITLPTTLNLTAAELQQLRDLLRERREFMARLLENPAVLEDESFTDTLFASYHLCEELNFRQDFSALPESDIDHLNGDVVRAFRALAIEWLTYMAYLSKKYPYLYSLYLRINPFAESPEPIV